MVVYYNCNIVAILFKKRRPIAMIKIEESLDVQAMENMLIISINNFLRCLPIIPKNIRVLEMEDKFRPNHNTELVKVSLSSASYGRDNSTVYTGSLHVNESNTGFEYFIKEYKNTGATVLVEYFVINGKKIKAGDIKNIDVFTIKNTIDILSYWATTFSSSYQYAVPNSLFSLGSDIFKYQTYLSLNKEA